MDTIKNTDVMIFNDTENSIYVWIDESQLEYLKNIEGISLVSATSERNRFHIYFDPRYDRESVIKEIYNLEF